MILVSVKLKGRPDWSRPENRGDAYPSVFLRHIGDKGIRELFAELAEEVVTAARVHKKTPPSTPYQRIVQGDMVDGGVLYAWEVKVAQLADEQWGEIREAKIRIPIPIEES